MHTKMHNLVKLLFVALVFGLLSGCGGSSSGDDGTTPTSGVIPPGGGGVGTGSNLTHPYDFPNNVAKDAFPAPVTSGLVSSAYFPQINANVAVSEYTLKYLNVSADEANKLYNTLNNSPLFSYESGFFVFRGNTQYYASKKLTKATALISYGANGSATVTFGLIFNGRADASFDVGPQFYADLFGEVDAEVSTISTLYFYRSYTLSPTKKYTVLPYAFNAYRALLAHSTYGYISNKLIDFDFTEIPNWADSFGKDVNWLVETLQKDIGDFRYQWSYSYEYYNKYDTRVGAVLIWTITRKSTI